MMLKFPFKNIDSLEIFPELVEISNKNFQKLKINRVKIFNENASSFNGYNNYKYFYLYNPFPKKYLKKVIAKIDEQIKKKKYSLYTIILNVTIC